MRAFIAIELPEEIRKHLSGLQRQFQGCGADVKWVEPQNIHLTLKFLGEIDETTVEKVAGAMERAVTGHRVFECCLGTTGAFPGIESPRVIWAGLTEGDSSVKEIAAELEQALSEAGIPAETRPFSSHITLGRTRSAHGRRGLSEKLRLRQAGPEDTALRFTVKKITLFKSTLTPRGPVYEAIREALLQK